MSKKKKTFFYYVKVEHLPNFIFFQKIKSKMKKDCNPFQWVQTSLIKEKQDSKAQTPISRVKINKQRHPIRKLKRTRPARHLS